jgi:hypothetical protein
MSDAMSHLLEEEEKPGEEGPSPEQLRRIVEREFADEDGGSEYEERPRPHLVEAPEEEPEPMGQVCSFETRRCEDVGTLPEEPPRH